MNKILIVFLTVVLGGLFVPSVLGGGNPMEKCHPSDSKCCEMNHGCDDDQIIHGVNPPHGTTIPDYFNYLSYGEDHPCDDDRQNLPICQRDVPPLAAIEEPIRVDARKPILCSGDPLKCPKPRSFDYKELFGLIKVVENDEGLPIITKGCNPFPECELWPPRTPHYVSLLSYEVST